MEREIKFRAWTMPECEMTYSDDYKNLEDHNKLAEFFTCQNDLLMQYTGLKDKNGKDIYEGDIILTPTDKPMVINWSEKFASFCIDRDGWAFSHWFGESTNPQNCEVIGNIYENPELLK